jgi:hypothetical protein
MELGMLVAIVCGVVLWALLRAGSDPSRSIVDMWRFRQPDWPSGVQEDDDLHWSWMAHAEPPDADAVDVPIDVPTDLTFTQGGDARRGRGAGGIDTRTTAEAEVIDGDPGEGPEGAGPAGGGLRVEVQPVTYEVRSADRARS